MGLDRLELLAAELARLEQDRVRDSDLADVVKWGCASEQLDLPVGQAEPDREQRAGAADPPRVLLGSVVAELGCNLAASGNLTVNLTGDLALIGGNGIGSSYAQIGNGGGSSVLGADAFAALISRHAGQPLTQRKRGRPSP